MTHPWNAPVTALTAASETDDSKPSSPRDDSTEAGGREAVSKGAFKLGDWIVEPELNRLRCNGQRVRVSPLAMDILTYLARPPGRVVGVDELVGALWRGRVVSDNPVYKVIAQLRRVLRDDADQPRYIETVRKRGYRLVASVSEPGADTSGHHAKHSELRHTDDSGCRVMVMPVSAIGCGQKCFCEGLAEEFKVQLAKIGTVSVVARPAPTRPKGPQDHPDGSPSEAEADLRVQATVRMSASRARVTVRLVRTRGGVQLWARSYELRAEDILDDQIAIAREVAHAVNEVV